MGATMKKVATIGIAAILATAMASCTGGENEPLESVYGPPPAETQQGDEPVEDVYGPPPVEFQQNDAPVEDVYGPLPVPADGSDGSSE